ncbi:unnamed protein product [Arabidopsis lyrata]|nr:unnamed protein product [Arabidopsis lyrata]
MKLLAKREDLEGDIEINKKSQHSNIKPEEVLALK